MNTLHYGVWPANRPHFLTVPQMNVSENLRISAMRYRAKTAMIFYDSTMTYGALDEAVDHLAGFLTQDLGVRRGDRVLLYLQNSPQFVISFYAILRANAIVVPVSPALMSEELAYFVEDAGAKVMIGGQDNLARITPLIGKTGLQQAIITAYSDALTQPTDLPMPDFLSAPNQVPQMAGLIRWNEALGKMRISDPITTGPDDLAVFPYTSGTTGRPKGCMHTHRSVMFNIAGATSWRASSTPDAMVLAALPFFHVTGMQGIMNASIYAGATLVLLPRWDRTIAARMIERYRISDWTAITTMVVDFLSNPELERFDISSLTRLGGGGAAMPEAVAEKLKVNLGLDFIEGYGLSETMAPSHTNPPDRPKKQCLGIPFFNTDSRIIDPNTLEELPQGQQGEIIIHGPQVFQGYWNDPDKTKDAFIIHDGKSFFRSGDLGYIDAEGYFFYTDRLKRMINCSGLKVWPAEVEAIMYQHPDLQSCCIIAALDPHRGETVKLVAVKKAGTNPDPAEIESWARERMAAYKVPRVVEFIDALPVSATGKVNWRALQEREKAKA